MLQQPDYYYPEVAHLEWREDGENPGLELKFYPARPDLKEVEVPAGRVRILFSGEPTITPNYLDLLTGRIICITDDDATTTTEIWYEMGDSEHVVKITGGDGSTGNRILETYENRAAWHSTYPAVRQVLFRNSNQVLPGFPVGYEGLVIHFEEPDPSNDDTKIPPDNQVCILIDDQQRCCETWHVEISAGELAWLSESRIRRIGYNAKREKDRRGGTPETSFLCVDIILADERKIQVDVWSRHNGYYAHTVRVECHEIHETQEL